jgi:hypothetical protein
MAKRRVTWETVVPEYEQLPENLSRKGVVPIRG